MATPDEIWVRGENGLVWQQKLPLPEGLADRLTKGYLTRVADADGSPYVEPEPESAPETGAPAAPVPPAVTPKAAPAPLPDPPTIVDRKAVLVGYVVRHLGMKPDDAEALTKHDLMDKITVAVAARGGA